MIIYNEWCVDTEIVIASDHRERCNPEKSFYWIASSKLTVFPRNDGKTDLKNYA
ncbi:hypothetical protein [Rickettsia tamurae]|uniref:hypothetical protein n=1 Tax=Rickettsia tamurae TaxID=334545 RepID=UPI000A5C1B86|nr:hypothetical protein [Rickettsia tamurae]